MARGRAPVIAGVPARYRLVDYINRGLYSDVVEAINGDRNSMAVALKLIRAEGTQESVARLMFRREVEALKGLSHDAIVQIYDSFEGDEKLLGIELELVPGGRSLKHLLEEVQIERLSPPSPAWRIRQAARLGDAVLAAHKRKIIHRDIKPGNVLWNEDDETLKLADFGIAAVLELTARDSSGATLRGFYSRPYASPEQMLQKGPQSPSDVYSFGLLVAVLLSLKEAGDDFEPPQLGAHIAGVVEELRVGGVAAIDIEALHETLAGSLLTDPNARPSLHQIQDVLGRLLRTFVPRPEATIALTGGAIEKLHAAGFITDAKITEDLNDHMRIRLDRDDKGEVVKVYGRTLFAVLRPEARDPDEIRARDAGQNPGPIHEAHRVTATDCPVRIRIGPRGSGAALFKFARDADRVATVKATNELVELARLVIRIERERLPVFQVDGIVDSGQRAASSRREDRVGRAAGFTGSQTEWRDVTGGYKLKVSSPRLALPPTAANAVKKRLQESGVRVDEPELFDDAVAEDWAALFDDLRDVDILDDRGHLAGKVTGWDEKTQTFHVYTDKPRSLPVRGVFFVKNYQKERQLRQQETAIEVLTRGESARGDMAHLLSEAAVHRMGDMPWVDLLQEGLTPQKRVQDIVDRILASETVFCLQGPPGTGKTTIIAEVVAQLLEREPRARILVCSQANDAVANAIEKIRKVREDLKPPRDWVIVRDVRPERARIEGPWAGYDAAYREFVERLRKATGKVLAEDAAHRHTVEEWFNSVEHGTHQVTRDHHQLVQVWGTTTARSEAPLNELEGAPYDLVIIDEAAKATVGEVLVPIIHGRRLLLVGDQEQLPPFLENTTTDALKALGITEQQAKYSLFEHLFKLVPKKHQDMLDMQFRMHPSIGDIVSALTYGGRVKNGPRTHERPLPAGDFDRPHRVLWLDIVGRDYKQERGESRANDEERAVIHRVLTKLDADATKAGQPLTVAVIAAYRFQADKLRDEIEAAQERWPSLTVRAATVDSFQGREADVVLYSLVRTGSAERKFLADGHRFNVALSRARSLLILIGDLSGGRNTEKLKIVLGMIPDENQIAAEVFVPPPPLANQLAAKWGIAPKKRR